MNVFKFESQMIDYLLEKEKVEYLEDLFPLIPGLSPLGKTKLWTKIPSRKVGEYCRYVSYNEANTLVRKAGREAMTTLREFTGGSWYDVEQVRNSLLYPKGVENVIKILNLNKQPPLSRPALRAWEKINRGRDLFLLGMGTFDIIKAKQDIDEYYEEQYSYRGGYDHYSLNSLHSMGYLGTPEYSNVFNNKHLVLHFKRHWASWKEFGFEHMREILYGFRESLHYLIINEKYLLYSPRALYQKIEEVNAEIRLADLKRREIALNSAFPKIRIPDTELNIKVVENYEELKFAGTHFDNCIGSSHYAGAALVGLSCFLIIGHKGKEYICDINLKQRKVIQVKGISNSKAPKEIRNELDRICCYIKEIK